MRLASGEFVVFVDADDEVLPEYLESLHHIFELYPELNIACCAFQEIKHEDNIGKIREIAETSENTIEVLTREEWLLSWIQMKWRAAWPYMTRRVYLLEKNIWFPDYSMTEDMAWVVRATGNTKYVGSTSKQLYLYLQHTNSLCNRRKSGKEIERLALYPLKTHKEILNILKSINITLYDVYMKKEGYSLVQGLALTSTYTKWINSINSNNICNYYLNLNDDSLLVIPEKQLFKIFKINKKLYYITVRATYGISPNIVPEKIFVTCYNKLLLLYHNLKN